MEVCLAARVQPAARCIQGGAESPTPDGARFLDVVRQGLTGSIPTPSMGQPVALAL